MHVAFLLSTDCWLVSLLNKNLTSPFHFYNINSMDKEKILTTEEYRFFQQLFSVRKFDKGKTLKNIGTIKNLTDCDLQSFCSSILLNDEDLAKREVIRAVFEEILKYHKLSGKLYSFGSSTSGLGTYDSDIDFHLRVIGENGEPLALLNNSGQTKTYLKRARKILLDNIQVFYNANFIDAKVCPIVKLYQRKKRDHLVSMDLNVSNSYGIYNSIFINFLCQFSPRFQQLTTILRHWAKLNHLIMPSGFNSYTLTILVIFFLQSGENAIFKPIEQLDINLFDHYRSTDPEEFKSILYPKCKALVQDSNNECSVFELLRQFFVYYATFQCQFYVISPRKAQAFRKDDFAVMTSNDGLKFPLNGGLCIQDPFELERNLSKIVHFNKLDEFLTLCLRYQSKPESYFRNGVNFKTFIDQPSASSQMNFRRLLPCFCFLRSFFHPNGEYRIFNQEEHVNKVIAEFVPFVCHKVKELFHNQQVITLSDVLRGKLKSYRLESLARPANRTTITVATFFFEVSFSPDVKKRQMKRRKESENNGDRPAKVALSQEPEVEDEEMNQVDDEGGDEDQEEIVIEDDDDLDEAPTTSHDRFQPTTQPQPSSSASNQTASNRSQALRPFTHKTVNLDCVFRGDQFFFLVFHNTREGPYVGPFHAALNHYVSQNLCFCDQTT